MQLGYNVKKNPLFVQQYIRSKIRICKERLFLVSYKYIYIYFFSFKRKRLDPADSSRYSSINQVYYLHVVDKAY